MSPEKIFLVTFKPSEWKTQLVKADRVEVEGEHLAFLTAEGQLAALYLREIVESWSELQVRG
jgi:hypothetical protein